MYKLKIRIEWIFWRVPVYTINLHFFSVDTITLPFYLVCDISTAPPSISVPDRKLFNLSKAAKWFAHLSTN